jgi:pyruvate/2-oxoglutarate dehydrogenase complex dihydrolipoamide dehydrogenase (E3) component
MGGICLNWGCIPTKAMLRSAEVFHLMHRAKEFGLKAEGIGYDLDAVVKRSRGVAKQLSSGISHLMKKNKVTVVMGQATIPAKGRVSVKTDKGTEELRRRPSCSPPARGRASCRGSRRTAISSGPTATRSSRRGCPRSFW